VSQADWDTLQYYSGKVKFFLAIDSDDSRIHPSTYLRIAQLQSSESALFPSLRHLHYNLGNKSIPPIHIFLFLSPLLHSVTLYNFSDFENTIVGPFLASLSSPMLSHIGLRYGQMSVDIFKKYIVHFKQLRSLELSYAVFMSDFTLLGIIGTLPSLANLTLKAVDPASHPAHDAENINHKSGSPKHFEALESLCVKGFFFLIQHLLGFIDSPCLTTIVIYPVVNKDDHEPYNYLTPSMTIITSKWSQSLKNLVIDSSSCGTTQRYAISTPKWLMLLKDLHEMQTLILMGWMMDDMDDDSDMRRLVMSWPKLRFLRLPLHRSFISLSTLRIIAENCPELRFLKIPLNTSTIPPFDTSSKKLHHKLETLHQQIRENTVM
jgi:hypothetical protein